MSHKQRQNGVCLLVASLLLSACVTVPQEEVKSDSEKPVVSPPPISKPAPTPPPAPPKPVAVVPPPLPPTVIIQTEPAKIPEEVSQLMEFLSDWARYHEMSNEELKREVSSAQALFNKLKTEAARLRYAIALSLLSGSTVEDQRALSLLEPLLTRGSREPLKLLASLIAAQIQERGKLLRDEQKKSENLQQKLDALRSIEQSLRLRR
ncbi:MAG: hypothetical protein RLZZ502_1752 [Pseudomonadota bacterium]